MHLVVDGWSLIDRPGLAEALQLAEWLGMLTEAAPDLRVTLIHPEGSLPLLPGAIRPHALASPISAAGRLLFEQRQLPRLAHALGADLLYVPRPAAALASPLPVAVLLGVRSPARSPLLDRLREALGRAGAANAVARLCLADLASASPDCRGAEPVPPFVGAEFRPADGGQQSNPGLEPGYVLCCGVPVRQVPFLLAAWSWVEASTGEAAPLVLLGVEPAAERSILDQARAIGVESTVRIHPALPLGELPELFRRAAAYLNVDPEPNGQPLRWAMSCGVPVAGPSWPVAAAVLGRAGYLVQPGDARRLGAACLTLLVDEQVAADLRSTGLARAEAYRGRGPLEAWLRVFRRAAS